MVNPTGYVETRDLADHRIVLLARSMFLKAELAKTEARLPLRMQAGVSTPLVAMPP